MKRITAYDTGQQRLAVSQIPTVPSDAMDTLLKDYTGGFDDVWFTSREHMRLQIRYDYGQQPRPATPEQPHSELPDLRQFWAEKAMQRSKRKRPRR